MIRKLIAYLKFLNFQRKVKPDWAKNPRISRVPAPRNTYTWDPLWWRFSEKYDAEQKLKKEAKKAERAAKKAKRLEAKLESKKEDKDE